MQQPQLAACLNLAVAAAVAAVGWCDCTCGWPLLERAMYLVCWLCCCLSCRKCKLYRYEAGSNEWKERGLGVVKLLKHKENGKIRLLMRQEKTLKIRANHIGVCRQLWCKRLVSWY
jgi:hypothetical protein